MFFDFHAHLMDARYKNDLDEVIKRINDKKLTGLINAGYDLKSSKKAIELARENENFYAIVGMHPHDSKDYDDAFEKQLKIMLKEDKVLGLGEIGLDYHYDNSPRDIQRNVFYRQLDVALEEKVPVIIHTREACKDTTEILKQNFIKENKGAIHSFSGSKESAKEYLDMGFYLSFSGPVTFKNANKILEVIKYVPLDRILIETDCPYLTPTPFRGKRNEPIYVEYVAEKIAEIKGISPEEVGEITYNNVKNLFSL